jgi:hypothetical protein
VKQDKAPGSNPYVYPSDTFQTSGQPQTLTLADSKTVQVSEIVSLLERLLPPPDIAINHDLELTDQILSIFTSESICFGDIENILVDKMDWIDRIRIAIKDDEPLTFSIHGFPFKMPVPVKTNRRLADLGDYASLFALNRLMNFVGSIYKPGASLTVVCEDGFAPFMGVPMDNAKQYKAELSALSKQLQFEQLRFVTISEMEGYADYANVFEAHRTKLHDDFTNKSEAFIEQYNKVFPIIFRIVNSEMYADKSDELVEIYNVSESTTDLQQLKSTEHGLSEIIDDISGRTHEAVLSYFAYLKARDDLGFVEKVAPDSLPLSVSPKRGRLGVFPIERKQTKLPYHSVPIVKSDGLSLEYLYDVERSYASLVPVQLKGDSDNMPFYYEY